MNTDSTFERTFAAWLEARVDDPDIKVYWGRVPDGAPTTGIAEVAIYYVPGGDREVSNSGVTDEHGRRLQLSIFSPDPQDVKSAAKALHTALDGFFGDLDDGTHIWAILPDSQGHDAYDNLEKVHQTDFDVMVRMTEGS